jgi:hypothetical protein
MSISNRAVLTSTAAFLLIAAIAVSSAAQTDQTASKFYLAYRAAFDKAKSIDELLPFMAAERRKEIESTPAGERAKMFEMIKEFGALSQVKVVSETKTANGATLAVEGVGSSKSKTTCTITTVREGNAWKIGRESCKGGM